MMQALAYAAAALIGLWGIAHAMPTKQVVAGFASITVDNRRVLIQEWLAESFTMWGMAALVAAVTVVAPDAPVTVVVYRVAAALLVALAVLTSLDRCPHRGRVVQDLSGAIGRQRGTLAGGQHAVTEGGAWLFTRCSFVL